MSISKSTENAGWRMITTSVIGINQEKSTFFIQIAARHLKEKVQKKIGGSSREHLCHCIQRNRRMQLFKDIHKYPDILRVNKKSSTEKGNSYYNH